MILTLLFLVDVCCFQFWRERHSDYIDRKCLFTMPVYSCKWKILDTLKCARVSLVCSFQILSQFLCTTFRSNTMTIHLKINMGFKSPFAAQSNMIKMALKNCNILVILTFLTWVIIYVLVISAFICDHIWTEDIKSNLYCHHNLKSV